MMISLNCDHLAAAGNDFDESFTLTAALLAAPGFVRCGVMFQTLRNKNNQAGSWRADGYVLSVGAVEADFFHRKLALFVLSRTELLVKYPFGPCQVLFGRYLGPYVQSHQASIITHIMDERFETRRHHYVLFKFPPSHPVENLFSTNPTSAKVSPEWALYDYEHVSDSVPQGSFVQWAIALADTKERVNLGDGAGNEAEEAIRRGQARARRTRAMDIGDVD
jgi:hypothetical protein